MTKEQLDKDMMTILDKHAALITTLTQLVDELSNRVRRLEVKNMRLR